MPTLFEISSDLQALEARLAGLCLDGGELPPEREAEAAAIMDEYLVLTDHREHKVDAWVAWIRHHELRASVRRAEYDRILAFAADLDSLVRRDEREAERRIERLKYALERFGLKKVECDRCCVSVQGNGGVKPVDIGIPAEQLPERFRREVTEVVPDRVALRAALEAGEEIPGVALRERGTRLVIK